MTVVTVARNGQPDAGTVIDRDGTAFARWDAVDGTAYLIRPDQHVAARWRRPRPGEIGVALDRALGRGGATEARRAAGG